MAQKPYERFDENKNLLLSEEGVSGGSHLVDNMGFYCSSCLKHYFGLTALKNHKMKCKIIWVNGITKNNGKISKEILGVISNMGSISRGAQRITFPMTHHESFIRLNQTVLVYSEENKILGFITYCKRKISGKEYYSLDDFFVCQYTQRRGIGKKLFEAMLSDLKIEKDHKERIVSDILVCSPSNSMQNFLIKEGLGNMRMWR